MYVQELEPVAGSLGLSALVAALPLLIVLVLLGGVRMKAHLAGLIGLAAAVAVAWLAYGMPLDQTLSSGVQGAVFGLFPIMWIVVNALWIYRMTVRTRHFDILRRSFGRLSDDPRIQALVVAFCFGALLEALAGFGAPVAISAVMLVALGFDPVRAAVVALVANTAPVAFGAMGTPVVTLAQVTGLPLDSVASVVGRQTPCWPSWFRSCWCGWSTAGADCARPGCPPWCAASPSPWRSSPPPTSSPRSSPTSAPPSSARAP